MIYIAVISNREITAEPLYNTPLVHWTHAWLPHNYRDSIWSPHKVPNYTAWWQRHNWCEQLAQSRCLAVHRPGVEPATFRSQVQRASHYTTEVLMLSCRCQDTTLTLACSVLWNMESVSDKMWVCGMSSGCRDGNCWHERSVARRPFFTYKLGNGQGRWQHATHPDKSVDIHSVFSQLFI